jgi:hypothetical protein
MTLDLEVNEVEVKVLTSLASVTGITGRYCRLFTLLYRPGGFTGSPDPDTHTIFTIITAPHFVYFVLVAF